MLEWVGKENSPFMLCVTEYFLRIKNLIVVSLLNVLTHLW